MKFLKNIGILLVLLTGTFAMQSCEELLGEEEAISPQEQMEGGWNIISVMYMTADGKEEAELGNEHNAFFNPDNKYEVTFGETTYEGTWFVDETTKKLELSGDLSGDDFVSFPEEVTK